MKGKRKHSYQIISSETAWSIETKLSYEICFGSPLSELSPKTPASYHDDHVTKNRKLCKKSLKNYLLSKCLADGVQTTVERSLDGPLS